MAEPTDTNRTDTLPPWDCPPDVAGRLNRPSVQNGLRCSEIELLGPRDDLGVGPQSSREVRSAP
eukprot:13350032-Alexandrium_andersonii.AAC.1